MSIVMSINRNTFFHLFTPSFANANKNFEVFNQKVLRKPSLSLHYENLRILSHKNSAEHVKNILLVQFFKIDSK